MSQKIVLFMVLTAVLVGYSNETAAGPAPSPQGQRPSYTTTPPLNFTRSLHVLLDTSGLNDSNVLQVVERFALNNNLVSRGVFPAKIRGGQAHFYSLDQRAIDSAVVRVALCGSTNAVIEALYNGTNDVYFDALSTRLRTQIESNFTGRILETHTDSEQK
jgi:hypothetical protein